MDAKSSPSADRAGASACRPEPTPAGADPAAHRGPAAPRRPDRIKKRPDFLAAARGASAAAPGFVLQGRCRPDAHPAGATAARLGLTASKKVGGAVVRSRAKRRLRALGEEIVAAQGRPGWDYVLIAREGRTVSRDFATMRAELIEALARVHAGERAPRGRPEGATRRGAKKGGASAQRRGA